MLIYCQSSCIKSFYWLFNTYHFSSQLRVKQQRRLVSLAVQKMTLNSKPRHLKLYKKMVGHGVHILFLKNKNTTDFSYFRGFHSREIIQNAVDANGPKKSCSRGGSTWCGARTHYTSKCIRDQFLNHFTAVELPIVYLISLMLNVTLFLVIRILNTYVDIYVINN